MYFKKADYDSSLNRSIISLSDAASPSSMPDNLGWGAEKLLVSCPKSGYRSILLELIAYWSTICASGVNEYF